MEHQDGPVPRSVDPVRGAELLTAQAEAGRLEQLATEAAAAFYEALALALAEDARAVWIRAQLTGDPAEPTLRHMAEELRDSAISLEPQARGALRAAAQQHRRTADLLRSIPLHDG